MSEIYTLRRLVEMESIKELINTATDGEIAELKAALDEYIQMEEEYLASNNDAEAFARFLKKDMDFHYQIVLFSHNALFKDLFLLIWPLIQKHVSSVSTSRHVKINPDGVRAVDPHVQLFECIQRRDWKACKAVYPRVIGEPVPLESQDIV